MFTRENTNGEFTTNELDIMNSALDIMLYDYRDMDTEELEQIRKRDMDLINDRWTENATVDSLIDDGREYAYSQNDDAVVFRPEGDETWYESGICPDEITLGGLPTIKI